MIAARENTARALLLLAACLGLGRPLARACEPGGSLRPIGLAEGAVDGGGRIAAGSDLLLLERCDELRCTLAYSAIDLALFDARGVTLPASLAAIEPSPERQRLLRLHPSSALMPGPHRLRIRVERDAGQLEDHTYPFTVEGSSSVAPSAAMTIEVAGPVGIDYEPAGTRFRCTDAVRCGASDALYTQRQRIVLLTAAVSEPPPAIELGQYVYRLVPFQAGPGAPAPWVAFGSVDGASWLRLASREPGAVHCVELQALRIRDMQVQTVSARCVRHELGPALPEPEPFARCAVREGHGQYARAWCSENRRACSVENTEAANERVRSACSAYPQICAPFLASQAPSLECEP